MPVSSDEKQLSVSEIVVAALREQNVPQNMIAPSVIGFVKEGTMPDTDVRNFGNTAFITHFKEKNNIKVAFGRALNADTARNYLINGEDYFKYLIDENVDYFFATYKDPKIGIIFKYIQRPEVQARVGGTAIVRTTEGKGGFLTEIKIETSK
jgi:hypothetical protein